MMLTDEERRSRIKALEEQVAEMEEQDKSFVGVDEPIYTKAIQGLRNAINYQQHMLDKGR